MESRANSGFLFALFILLVSTLLLTSPLSAEALSCRTGNVSIGSNLPISSFPVKECAATRSACGKMDVYYLGYKVFTEYSCRTDCTWGEHQPVPKMWRFRLDFFSNIF